MKFDKIITGKITSSGNQIQISLRLIQKDETSNTYKIANSFSIQSYNFQIDYYLKEIAQKLINSKYTINEKNAPPFSDTRINIADIQIVKIESMNLGLYKFAVEDSKLNSLIEGMNIYIQEADGFYKEKNFTRALAIYKKILDSTSNLSDTSKLKIKDYISELEKRINLSYTNIFKAKIESLDSGFKDKQDYSIEDFAKFYSVYKEQFDTYKKLPEYSQNKVILDTFNSRLESMKISQLKLLEKKADEYYQSLDFNKAGNLYNQVIADTNKYLHFDKYASFLQKIEDKKILNKKSAISFLDSNLISYTSFSESENSRFILELSMGNSSEASKRKENAVASLNYLKKMLTTSLFLSDDQILKFNEIANRINERPEKLNVSATNIVLLPVRYIGNIGKGITDIFVIKLGYGVGVGTQVAVFGTDGGIAHYPLELSTAYQGKKSELSGFNGTPLNPEIKKWRKGNFGTDGLFYVGESTCTSGIGFRICQDVKITLIEKRIGQEFSNMQMKEQQLGILKNIQQ